MESMGLMRTSMRSGSLPRQATSQSAIPARQTTLTQRLKSKSRSRVRKHYSPSIAALPSDRLEDPAISTRPIRWTSVERSVQTKLNCMSLRLGTRLMWGRRLTARQTLWNSRMPNWIVCLAPCRWAPESMEESWSARPLVRPTQQHSTSTQSGQAPDRLPVMDRSLMQTYSC